ncbi:MAG: STAS domain-containing protein [Verrucomicrobiota bacterium]
MQEYAFSLSSNGTAMTITVDKTKFDASSVDAFNQALKEHWKQGISDVDIDFSKVEFIDSSGIGALLGVQKRLQSDSQPIRILNARKNVVSVIELLRLHRVFSIAEA